MGAGKGGNYGKGKGDDEENIGKFADNLLELLEEYDLSPEGFFGVRSGRFVRHIFGQDPLETMIDFVSRAILHAKIIPMKNGHGYRAVFSDGFEIDYRETSSTDGTPAIELWTRTRTKDSSSTVSVTISDQTFSIRYQKIHFVQEEKSDEGESSDSTNDN